MKELKRNWVKYHVFFARMHGKCHVIEMREFRAFFSEEEQQAILSYCYMKEDGTYVLTSQNADMIEDMFAMEDL